MQAATTAIHNAFPNTEVDGVESRSGVKITIKSIKVGDGETQSCDVVVWHKAQRNLFSKYRDLRKTAMKEITAAMKKEVKKLIAGSS